MKIRGMQVRYWVRGSESDQWVLNKEINYCAAIIPMTVIDAHEWADGLPGFRRVTFLRKDF